MKPSFFCPRFVSLIAVLLILVGWTPVAIAATAASAAPSVSAKETKDSRTKESEAVPRFSPDGGVFTSRQSLRLDGVASDDVIRYTLNGTEPTSTSPVYAEPIAIGRTTLVRARLFRRGQPAGPSVAQTYTMATADLGRFSGNLPLVVVNVFGQQIQHETRRVGSLNFIDTQNGRSALVGSKGVDVRGEIWWRGKSSLRYVKRSLGVKTRDDMGKSRSVSLLGFPADSDWVLYAPYPDKTLIRDVVAYELSNQMGHYASRTRFVEVFINEGTGRLTMEHYMGVYVLEEKIKRAPERVNVQKLGTNDNAEPLIAGGYIIKKDHGDTMGDVEPTIDGRPNWGGGGGGGNSGSRYGYPTGPGGFPADPRGFLPTLGGERSNGRQRGFSQSPRPPLAPLDARGFDRIDREIVIQDGRPVIVERQIGRENRMPDGGRRGMFPGRVWTSSQPAVEELFVTDQGNEFYYVEPKEDEITPPQRQWLRNYMNEFERVLHGTDFADPKKGYAAYIDADSFIDYHLIVEVTKNIDGFRFSTYYQKDREGRIKAQPIWDWNLSFGNANGKQGWMPDRWYWPQLDDQQYSYYRRLFEDPEFAQRYVDRWGQLRKTVFSDSNILARIDAQVARLGEARVRNFSKWPILGRMIWPNNYVGQTYEDEIRYMKDWTRKRLTWIDAQFTPPPRLAVGKAGGQRMILYSSLGQVYYTTDGSDPRARGGSPSSRATVMPGESLPLNPGTKLVARSVFEGRWSPPVRLP